MTTPGGVTPPNRPPQQNFNLAAGQLNYGQQQVQATTAGFQSMGRLLSQIATLLGKGGPVTATAGSGGFGGVHTFGSTSGTAAQWASMAQQRARMTATAAGRLAGMGDPAQQFAQANHAHQEALRRMQAQQLAFTLQWQNQQHSGQAQLLRGGLSQDQIDSVNRRLAISNQQYQNRTLSYQGNVSSARFQFQAAQDRLMQQRRDLEAQVRQGHMDQYAAGRAMMAARRTQGRQAAIGAGLEIGGKAIGAVGGMVSSYYSSDDFTALSQFGRQMSMVSPIAGMTAGAKAKYYGQNLMIGGLNNWATSTSDWVGGGSSIMMQTAPQFRTQALANAGADAFVSGFGVQAAARAQAELGTSQSFYAARMFGLPSTRGPGGRPTSLTDMAMGIANRVNRNRFSSLSDDQLSAELSQGGSLSYSLQTVGQASGWSGQTLDMMNYQLRAMRNLMNPVAPSIDAKTADALRAMGKSVPGAAKAMSQEEAQQTIKLAAAGDTSSIDKLKAAGMDLGSSYQDAQNMLAGKDREGHLGQSADYLDAAKSSADSLVDIKNLLNKVLGPLAGVMGSLAGGGIMGTLANHPVISGAIGSLMGPLGTITGLAPSIMKTMGGGDAPVTSARQNSPGAAAGAAAAAGAGRAGGNAGAVIAAAEHQLGKPYLWGGTGPDGWDCSGLMQAAYKQGAGINLPRVSEQQATVGVEVPMDQLIPGDLVFPRKDAPPHVAMYIGGGKIIEAPRTGLNVREVPMGDRFHYARRVLGGAGSAAAKATPSQNGAGAVASGVAANAFTSSGSYGSTEEVDALAAALGGGAGGGSAQAGSPPSGTSTQNAAASGGTEGSAGAGKGSGTTDASGAKAIAKSLMSRYGFGADQFDALDWLWTHESGWSSTADNPKSTAYGIPQALEFDPKSGTGYKMTGEYADYHTNATTQIKWGLNYIKSRYGNPVKAKAFWQAHNWYDRGAWDIEGDQIAKLHAGEMVLTKSQATTMRQALMEGGLGGSGGTGSVELSFQPGAIVISMPTATADGAQSAARSFVDYVVADDRIKSLMGGW